MRIHPVNRDDDLAENSIEIPEGAINSDRNEPHTLQKLTNFGPDMQTDDARRTESGFRNISSSVSDNCKEGGCESEASQNISLRKGSINQVENRSIHESQSPVKHTQASLAKQNSVEDARELSFD